MDRFHVAGRSNGRCGVNITLNTSDDTISWMKKKRNSSEDIARCLWLHNLGYENSQIAAEMGCDEKHASVLVRGKNTRQSSEEVRDKSLKR